jgi:hypothetical protein
VVLHFAADEEKRFQVGLQGDPTTSYVRDIHATRSTFVTNFVIIIQIGD